MAIDRRPFGPCVRWRLGRQCHRAWWRNHDLSAPIPPLARMPMLGICGLHDKTKAEATVFSLFLRDRNPVEVEVVCHGATSVNTSVVQGILHM